jgi:hypothetical protein
VAKHRQRNDACTVKEGFIYSELDKTQRTAIGANSRGVNTCNVLLQSKQTAKDIVLIETDCNTIESLLTIYQHLKIGYMTLENITR